MRTVRATVVRLLVILTAAGLPLGAAILISGPPPALDVASLDQWSPVRGPGPSTALLSQGVTALVVGMGDASPDWLKPEQADLVQKASAALQADRLRSALGYMLTLSDQLEADGRTLHDMLPIIMPGLASWMIANYFAPMLLGVLLVTLVILISGPWLARRFYDFLKLVSAMTIGLVGIGLAASLCFAIAQQKALVFSLIEYLVVVAVLLAAGNLLLIWGDHRKKRRLAAAAAARERHPGMPRLTARREARLGKPAVSKPVTGAEPTAATNAPAFRPLYGPTRET